jgi:hypothetical protein
LHLKPVANNKIPLQKKKKVTCFFFTGFVRKLHKKVPVIDFYQNRFVGRKQSWNWIRHDKIAIAIRVTQRNKNVSFKRSIFYSVHFFNKIVYTLKIYSSNFISSNCFLFVCRFRNSRITLRVQKSESVLDEYGVRALSSIFMTYESSKITFLMRSVYYFSCLFPEIHNRESGI